LAQVCSGHQLQNGQRAFQGQWKPPPFLDLV
jgi:hypothetical protein